MRNIIRKRWKSTLAISKNLLGERQVLVTVALLLLMLGIVVRSVEEVQWISPQPSLILILVLAITTTWIFSRTRIKGAILHLLILIAGLVVVFWQGLGLFVSSPGNPSTVQLVHFLSSLGQSLIQNSPVEGTAHFALFLAILTWILGYVSTWFALRKQNAWVGVSLGIIALLVNLSNLPNKYYINLFFFVLAAIALISWIKFSRDHISILNRPSKQGLVYFAGSLICLSLIASLLIIPIPDFNLSQTSPVVSMKIFWQDKVQSYFNNVLAAVPSQLPIVSAGDQDELLFSNYNDSQKEEIQFITNSPQPYYWRTNDYDTYISTGWTNNEVTGIPLNNDTDVVQSQDDKQRVQINYKVTAELKTNVILVAGNFENSDSPVELYTTSNDTGSNIDTETIASIVSTYQLNPGEHYNVTASVSTANPEQLSTAGTMYPSWVTDNYLQLPSSLPTRVRQLSRRITRRARTPYDKVLAVKQYLSDLTYEPESNAPPTGSDGVDYFLFNSKTGNCGYFASAAVVLLRAAGVPARLAVGYISNEWDATTNTNTIRAKNAHAWPEVYFPGYGWIEFEATPGNPTPATNETDPAPTAVISGEGYATPDYSPYQDNITTTLTSDTGSTAQPIVPVHKNTIITMVIIFIILGITGLYLTKEIIQSRLHHYGILRGKPDFATEVYQKLCIVSGWSGVRPFPQETLYEFKERLVNTFPGAALSIEQMVDSYAEVRFSPRRKPDYDQEVKIQKAWIEFYKDNLKKLLRKKWFQIYYRGRR